MSLESHNYAIDTLREATRRNPHDSSVWYDLGLALSRQGDVSLLTEAISSLDRARALIGERTTAPGLWDDAGHLIETLSTAGAREERPLAQSAIAMAMEEARTKAGMPVQIEEVPLPGITGKLEFAWVHHRSFHRVLVAPQDEVAKAHAILHELEHLRLVNLARDKNRNRWIASTPKTRERALGSIAEDIARLTRRGLPPEALSGLSAAWVDGLLLQLFNCPIDLLVDRRVLASHPRLRELVYRALKRQVELAVRIVEDVRVAAITPMSVFHASAALNGALALTFEELYPRRTDLIGAFEKLESWATSKRLYAAWKESADRWEPGDEYEWVDNWASVLGLTNWYEWLDGNP